MLRLLLDFFRLIVGSLVKTGVMVTALTGMVKLTLVPTLPQFQSPVLMLLPSASFTSRLWST